VAAAETDYQTTTSERSLDEVQAKGDVANKVTGMIPSPYLLHRREQQDRAVSDHHG